MGENVTRSTLTDAELEALGVEIPKDETDASFFNWLDNMIEDAFKDDKESK